MRPPTGPRSGQPILRVVPPDPIERRQEGRPCEVAGCRLTTYGGKPFCPDHLERNPYVSALVADLEVREEEVRWAMGGKRLRPDGALAREVLRELRFRGPRTVTRLARDENLPARAIEAAVRALELGGLVRVRTNRRGWEVVELLEREELDEPARRASERLRALHG